VAVHLNEIAAKSREVDQLIAEIAGASQEQTQGIVQVNTAIGEMDRVVQGGAARAEEGASVAQELTDRSAQLQHAVDDLASVVGGQSTTARRPMPSSDAHQTPTISKTKHPLELASS
jgi:methyl-accepting chemotaxis protein